MQWNLSACFFKESAEKRWIMFSSYWFTHFSEECVNATSFCWAELCWKASSLYVYLFCSQFLLNASIKFIYQNSSVKIVSWVKIYHYVIIGSISFKLLLLFCLNGLVPYILMQIGLALPPFYYHSTDMLMFSLASFTFLNQVCLFCLQHGLSKKSPSISSCTSNCYRDHKLQIYPLHSWLWSFRCSCPYDCCRSNIMFKSNTAQWRLHLSL